MKSKVLGETRAYFSAGSSPNVLQYQAQALLAQMDTPKAVYHIEDYYASTLGDHIAQESKLIMYQVSK